jgi:hypothetical protein
MGQDPDLPARQEMSEKRRLIGIRGQFLFLLGSVLLFVTVSTTMLSTHAQRDSLLRERKLRGSSVLRSWSSLCRERLLSDESVNLSMWDFVDDMMKHESSIEQIYLLDTNGTILMHNDQAKVGSRCPSSELQDLRMKSDTAMSQEKGPTGVHLHFQQTISVSGKRLGYAVVVFSAAGIEDGIQAAMFYIVLTAAAIGLTGLLLASVLVYQVSRPIQLLVEGVRRFGEKFDPENPASADVQIAFRSFNEIGDVRDSFNSMTSALSTSLAERKRLKEETGFLRVQATTDGMTGLYNKRQFQEEFPVLVKLAVKKSTPLCLMMLDMDHFKQLNDTMGHNAGDKALQDLADSLRARVRSSDRAYRIGGDEFILISGVPTWRRRKGWPIACPRNTRSARRKGTRPPSPSGSSPTTARALRKIS